MKNKEKRINKKSKMNQDDREGSRLLGKYFKYHAVVAVFSSLPRARTNPTAKDYQTWTKSKESL